MKSAQPLNRENAVIFLTVFFVSLAVYVRTLCPTVYVGDSGELIAAAATLGIPHPPGFPLYVILGKIFITLFRFSNIAYRMNLFSALCSAATCGMLALLMRRVFSVGAMVSVLFGLIFAFSFTNWSMATVAVTYPLSSLITVLGILVLFSWLQNKDKKHLSFFFFCVGLGFATHTLTIVLLLSAVILIVLNVAGKRGAYKGIGRSALWLIPGLILYLFIPLRASMKPAVNWSDPETIPRLFRFLTRADYWKKAYVENISDFIEVVRHYLKTIPQEFSLLGLLLLLCGIYYLARKNWKYLVFFLSLFFFNIAAMCLHGSRSDIFYWSRYMLTGFIGLACIIAAGLVFLKGLIKIKFVYYLIPLVLLALLFFGNFKASDKSRNFVAYDYNMAILNYLPQNTVLMAESDNVLFPLVYLHIAEKKRPDIKLVQQGIEVLSSMRINPKTEAIYFTHYHDFQSPQLKLVPDGLGYRLVLKDSDFKSSFDWNKYSMRNLGEKREHLDYLSRNLLGDYLFSKGINFEFSDFNRALEYFVEASRIDYNNSNMFVNLGLVFERHGMYKPALLSFQKALAIDKKEEVAKKHIEQLSLRGFN